ncbi:hypothetical protein JOQ06_029155 [Pogonophryne albipinna]|uniref:Transmembrane protein n=1 Tax=Pogonophryne albipinna TaxID=1090488 RepID=A0AAD6FLQ5_9TELE|nr:hypothetical protein JOQ06_029155 [Pogonophryne albipinna]
MNMEELKPRKPLVCSKKMRSPIRQPYRSQSLQRFGDCDDVMMDPVKQQDVQVNSTFSSQTIIYYTLLFLKMGLWICFAWVMAHLHLGLPCFILPLILWLYSGPMHSALKWAKRRLRGNVE